VFRTSAGENAGPAFVAERGAGVLSIPTLRSRRPWCVLL